MFSALNMMCSVQERQDVANARVQLQHTHTLILKVKGNGVNGYINDFMISGPECTYTTMQHRSKWPPKSINRAYFETVVTMKMHLRTYKLWNIFRTQHPLQPVFPM